jgi:transmembrane sensor
MDDIPWDTITAWLAGTCSAAEAERLAAWADGDPDRRKLMESMRLLWEGAAEAGSTWDAKAALAAIKARGTKQPRIFTLSTQTPKPPSTRWLRRGLAAAAAVAIVAGGWWAATIASSVDPQAKTALTMRRYATTRGQRLALKLPDGSGVVLGPESAIEYALTYGQQGRDVELRGEAAFEVVHDAAHPFEVRTAYATVRDLGTRFVVRALPAAPAVEVAVAEGSVALGARQASAPVATLGRGDWGQVSPSGILASRHDVSLEPYFGWTEGRLVFEAADLASVVAELNRWYDVDIVLADSAAGRLRLTATFHDQPITEVLSSIQASLRLELSGAGRRFTLATRSARP